MGIVGASIPVIGAGLALGWGLGRLRSQLSRGRSAAPRNGQRPRPTPCPL